MGSRTDQEQGTWALCFVRINPLSEFIGHIFQRTSSTRMAQHKRMKRDLQGSSTSRFEHFKDNAFRASVSVGNKKSKAPQEG